MRTEPEAAQVPCQLGVGVGTGVGTHRTCVWLCQSPRAVPVCCLPAVLESPVTPLCVPERDVHPAESVIRKG